jgi:hypothetical protein
MLAISFSPLTGFQGEDDYHSVLETMHLADGLAWAIPVVLSVGDDELHRVGGAEAVALCASEGGAPIAILRVTGQFKRDKHKEAVSVYRTDDLEHPGVKAMYEGGDTCVAGTLEVIALPGHDDFTNYRLTPSETREAFRERGWKTVVGFQTRNPIHRAHVLRGRAGDRRRSARAPAGGRDEAPTRSAGGAHAVLRGVVLGVYPRDCAMISAPAAAPCGFARGVIWHAIAQELRMHPLHRRA